MATRTQHYARFFEGSSSVRWVFDDLNLEVLGLDVVAAANLSQPMRLEIDGPPGIGRTIAFPASRVQRVNFPAANRVLMRIFQSDADVGPGEDITEAALADPDLLADILDGLVPFTGPVSPSEIGIGVSIRITKPKAGKEKKNLGKKIGQLMTQSMTQVGNFGRAVKVSAGETANSLMARIRGWIEAIKRFIARMLGR